MLKAEDISEVRLRILLMAESENYDPAISMPHP